jgi:hypothetical protein
VLLPDAGRNEAGLGPELDPGPRNYLDKGLAYLFGFGERALPIQRLLETTFTHGTSSIRVVFTPAYQNPVTAILAAVDKAGRR